MREIICSHLVASTSWWCHKMEAFSAYWPFVRGIHRSTVNSPHKGQWRGALIYSLICAWINGWVNNRDAGDLRRNCLNYDVTVMLVRALRTACVHHAVEAREILQWSGPISISDEMYCSEMEQRPIMLKCSYGVNISAWRRNFRAIQSCTEIF